MALVLRKAFLPKNISMLKCMKSRPLASTANKKNAPALTILPPRFTFKEQITSILPRGMSDMKAQPSDTTPRRNLKTTSLFRSVSCPAIMIDKKGEAAKHQGVPKTQSAVFYSQSDIHEYTPEPNVAPGVQNYYAPIPPDSSELLQHICSVGAASCPSPPSCSCGCGCGCLPPPCNIPPKCIQYMTGYYYYPYGFWFCGPYHVTGTMCPGGPVCPGGPCGPCPPSPGGPCGPCSPGCACAVLDTLYLGKSDQTSSDSKLDSERIADIFSNFCCMPLTASSQTKTEKPIGVDSRGICGPCCGACSPACVGPCKACCTGPCGYGPCGPCGPCGPFGPCGTGFPGMACGNCGPCGPCCGPCGPCCGPCGPCCGPCRPCCGPCGPCCGPCGPCCGPRGPCCGPCGPCGPCCGVSCYPPCVPLCRPWCGPCVNCAVPPLALANPVNPAMSQSMSGIVSSFGPPPMMPITNSSPPMMPITNSSPPMMPITNSSPPMMPRLNNAQTMMAMRNQATMSLNPHFMPAPAYSIEGIPAGQGRTVREPQQQSKRGYPSRPVSPRLVRKFPFSTTKECPPENLQSRTLPFVNSTLPVYFSTLSDLASGQKSIKSDKKHYGCMQIHLSPKCKSSCKNNDQKSARCILMTPRDISCEFRTSLFVSKRQA